jgi:hypothetical protein
VKGQVLQNDRRAERRNDGCELPDRARQQVVDDDALDHDTEQKNGDDGDDRGQGRIDAEHGVAKIDEIAGNSPWAKLSIFMVPQISVRPLAKSAYIDPTTMPLTI